MKAEPQPNHDVNRASGTDSDNGCWLRRLVRRMVDIVWHESIHWPLENENEFSTIRFRLKKPGAQFPPCRAAIPVGLDFYQAELIVIIQRCAVRMSPLIFSHLAAVIVAGLNCIFPFYRRCRSWQHDRRWPVDTDKNQRGENATEQYIGNLHNGVRTASGDWLLKVQIWRILNKHQCI